MTERVHEVFDAYERDKIEGAITNLCKLIGEKEASEFIEKSLHSDSAEASTVNHSF
jgi:hypothetical protein